MFGSRVPGPGRGAFGGVVLTVLVAAVLVGCSTSSSGTSAPSTAATTQPSGPLPIKVGMATPGTYTTTLFEPTLTFDIGSDGWLFFFADDDDEMAVGKSGDVELIASRVSQVVDPTSHQAVAAPEDLIAWLQAHPELDVQAADPASIAGETARAVDVAAPGDADVEIWAFPTGNVRVSAGAKSRIWVVPMDGPDLVLSGLAPVASFDTALPELEAIVQSMEIGDR
jgi:hypothetical protein